MFFYFCKNAHHIKANLNAHGNNVHSPVSLKGYSTQHNEQGLTSIQATSNEQQKRSNQSENNGPQRFIEKEGVA
jgi:hypothetical protein